MSGVLYFQQMRVTDANDDPVSGAKAYFYDTGTTTPQTVYSDSGLTAAHPVPLPSDSNGVFPAVYTDGTVQVKVNVTDADDVGLPGYPIDPVVFQSSTASASDTSFTPTARISATNVQDSIEEVDGSVEDIEDAREIEHTIYDTGGSSSAYTITVPGVTGYSTSDVYLIKLNHDNTGPATINVNSLGTEFIRKTNDGGNIVSLDAGDLYSGEIHRILYDGSRFIVLTPVQPTTGKKGGARKSTSVENLAGTSETSFPSVAGVTEMIVAQSAITATGLFNGTGTPAFVKNSGFNATITDNGIGDYTLAFASAVADADYIVHIDVESAGSGVANRDFVKSHTRTTGGLDVRITDVSGNPVDLDGISITVIFVA